MICLPLVSARRYPPAWLRVVPHITPERKATTMTAFNRITRKAALTAAGLAFTGGAIVGPVTAAYAAPADSSAKPVAASQRDDHGRRDSRDHRQNRELGIRYEPQPNFYYCGPASTKIALTAQGKAPSQDEVAKQLGTTENGTNSAEDITRALNKMTNGDKYKTTSIKDAKVDDAERAKLVADVVRAVDEGRAVVANIVGTATDTDGVAHSYEGGHYLSVVGYRDGGETVKIADPANPNQASYWMTTDNLADWMATRGYSA